jgi:predicted DNA-binding ribbon-helix-helix protein
VLNAGSVPLVIDHRAMRSALPKIAATESYNATLLIIAYARDICAIASLSYVRARQQRCLNRSALGASSSASVCSRRRVRNLCDFCNAPEFFLRGHTGAQIFWSDVALLLQGVLCMKSPVVKRSIVVGGHKTSVSLEDAFWKGLKEIAGRRHVTLSDLVGAIDSQRQHGNLSSALRLFVLDFYRSRFSEDIKGESESEHGVMASAFS